MRLTLVFCVLVVVTILAEIGDAKACSCLPNPYPPCRAYGDTPLIFSGTVTETHPKDFVPGDYQQRRATFRIEKYFKGTGESKIDVFTDGRCGVYFETGKKYLVYASGPDEHVQTGMCSRTQLIEDAGEDIAFLSRLAERPLGALLYGNISKYAQGFGTGNDSDIFLPLSNIPLEIFGAKKARVITDKKGNFKVTNFPPGMYMIRPILPKGLKLSRFTKSSSYDYFEIPERGCAEAKFYVNFEGEIGGRVFDKQGRPVKGVYVQIVRADAKFESPGDTVYSPERSITDAKGYYRITGIPPGRYLLGTGIGGAPGLYDKFGRVFYQSATDPKRATVITVRENIPVRNLNLTVPIGN